MYGFRKVVKGAESGCHMNPYFVRGKPENLQLIKRGGAPPPCLPYYQARVHRLSDVKTEEVQNDDTGFSEPEIVICSKGRKRTKDTLPQPYYVPIEFNGYPSECMEKRRKQHSGHDGTNGKPKEEILSNDEGQKWCEGRKHCLIPVTVGGGIQGEPKVVNGAKSAEIEARNANGSGEASNMPVYKKFPPGRKTLPTNSSGGKTARNVRNQGTYKQVQQQQHQHQHQHQHQYELGSFSFNSISSFDSQTSKRNSSYTDLLEYLKVISKGHPSLITTKSDTGPPSGVSEDWQKFFPSRFPPQSSRYSDTSSTLHDLAEVAGGLASQRYSLSKAQQDTQSINDDVQNGHFYMNDESQFEQKRQFDASAIGKSMLKADHDVTNQKKTLASSVPYR